MMKTDIFISYRRKDNGTITALAIYERLLNDGYQVFLDQPDIGSGNFIDKINDIILEAEDFLLILPKDCFELRDNIDIFRGEIVTAHKAKKNIIPVFLEGFDIDSFPPDLKDIRFLNGVSFQPGHFDGSIAEIEMKLESIKVRSAIERNTADFFNEVSNEEIQLRKNNKQSPEIRKKLSSILPLFEGIPCFTSKNSIQIRWGNDWCKEFYLAFPNDVARDISYSTSLFRYTDVNTDEFFGKLELTKEENERFGELLKSARIDTARKFIERRDGNYFNGMKFGIWHSDANSRTTDIFEHPVLHLDLFRTDYYSHQTMFALHRMLSEDPVLSRLTKREKKNINTFSAFRTSLGINLIVESPSENAILLTKRSANASYSDNKEWIAPAVTEAVSETDYDIYADQVNLDLCVMRGLYEELGAVAKYYDPDSIEFYNMFHETYYSQDNLSGSVKLREGITLRHLLSLEGRDTELEVSERLIVPLDKNELKSFILSHLEEFRPQALYTILEYLRRKNIDLN